MKIIISIVKLLALVLVSAVLVMSSVFGVTKFIAHRNTVYAENFNQPTFKSILVGTSMEDVERLLGQPLAVSKNDAGFESHSYSARKPGYNGDYYIKLIIYKDGRVMDLHEDYYID